MKSYMQLDMNMGRPMEGVDKPKEEEGSTCQIVTYSSQCSARSSALSKSCSNIWSLRDTWIT